MRIQPLLLLTFFSLCLSLFSYFSLFEKKESLEIYIIAGQSNAVGYNSAAGYVSKSNYYLSEQRDIVFWAAGNNTMDSFRNTWIYLRTGVSKINGYKNAFGPEISFGRYMADNHPNKKIGIIKYAIGGTSIARSWDYTDYIYKEFENFDDKNRNWYPPTNGQPSGLLYRAFIKNVRAALDCLEQQNKTYELKGIAWIQGEHEAGLSPTMAADYQRLLHNFIGHIRKDLGQSKLPVVIAKISDNWVYAKTVQAAQENVSAKNAYVKTVIAKDLPRHPQDDAHYTANGTVLLGIRIAKCMQELQSN